MASQYNLELKAILDTTQIKQELQKLRTLQSQTSTVNSHNITDKSSPNNSSNLNSTLAKLNISINQLNQKISKLNTSNQKTFNRNTGNVFSPSRSVAAIPATYKPRNIISKDDSSTSIKQELQKIRTLQNQVSTVNSHSMTDKNTLTNSGTLTSTLAKLNTSINQLNQNISRLNISNQKMLNRNIGGALSPSRSVAAIPATYKPRVFSISENDTSTSIKQELQKLRTLQNQVSVVNSHNIADKNNLNNSGNLNSTIAKLNTSINQLNQNISRLNISNQKMLNRNIGGALSPSRSVAAIPATYKPQNISISSSESSAFSILNSFGQYESDQQLHRFITDKKFRDQYYNKVALAKQHMQFAQAGIMGALPLFNMFQKMPSDEFATLYHSVNTPEFQKFYNNKITPKVVQQPATPWYKNQVVGPLAGLALGQVADTAIRWGETSGWADQKLPGNIRAGSVITTGAKFGEGVMMGSVGGIPGMIIGGVLGSVLGVFESLTRSTELFNQALQEATARVNQAYTVDKNIQTFFTNKNDEEAVKKRDLKYLNNELEKANKEYNEGKSFITHIIGKNSLADYEEETKRLIENKEYDRDDWQIKHRIQTAEQYKQNYSMMLEADSRRNKLQSAIDLVNNNNKSEEESRNNAKKNKEEQEQNLINQQNILRSNLNQSIDDEKYNYARFNELKHLQNYINSNDEDTIRKLISNYTDKAESSKSSYVGLLNDARSTDDIELKELLLKQARAKKDEWNFASAQVGNLNSALQNILIEPLQERLSRLTAPDMSNVNSLAGQGVMINRADDNSKQESLLNYQKQQTQLQEEIKKLLKDNSFTSTIM